MAQIGSLGSGIIFETSDRRILTFNKFVQKISGRWSTHDVIGEKPKSEFNGPGLRKVTFSIVLDAHLGVKPRKTMENMERMVERGEVEPLVVGSKRVGDGKWKMTDISEAWDYLYSRGEVVRATVDISLEEYC